MTSKKELIQEKLIQLKILRDDFSDEIPKKILHSTHLPGEESPKYKVRVGWFQASLAAVEGGIFGGLIDKKYQKEYDNFSTYMEKTDFRERDTIREDIDRVDNLLNNSIANLEGSLNNLQ